MWINGMLTIWLYGTIFSLVLIAFTLWLWYWRDADRSAPAEAEVPPHDVRGRSRDATE